MNIYIRLKGEWPKLLQPLCFLHHCSVAYRVDEQVQISEGVPISEDHMQEIFHLQYTPQRRGNHCWHACVSHGFQTLKLEWA